MINYKATLYLLAFPIGLMGFVQLVFALLSMIVFNDHEESIFFIPAMAMLLSSIILLALARRFDITKIGLRDSLIFAVLTWVIFGFLGAIPIKLAMQVSYTDAVFESVSGLTTTGATILVGLDAMPKTFLMYRQFLQWLGGLGIVIFVVAVLPMLNVGGMKLLKAETPGPIKDDKISPRIAHATQYLWLIYVLITVLCALSYYVGGMDAFDAIGHSFATVSTGGFSTHDASFNYFESPTLLVIADVFMVLGAFNFALHYRVLRARQFGLYWRDEESRTFLLIVSTVSLLVAALLGIASSEQNALSVLNNSVFMVISFITSTGFGVSNYTEWPYVVTFILYFIGYLGGCAGSTAGGNKIIRNILSVKVIFLEMKKLIHPNGIFQVKYQRKPVEKSVLNATMAFMFFAAFSSLFLTLLLMATGLDFWSSLTAVGACLNVLGPAFGQLGSNFQPVSDVGTWILSFAMILGRLEYFTVLALFLPSFWRD